MGVRLPVEMDPPRIGGSDLTGRGCASVGKRDRRGKAREEETGRKTEKKTEKKQTKENRQQFVLDKPRENKEQGQELHNHA